MAEIETNRDFYGQVRFDDAAFQFSEPGRALQAKFIAGFADQVRGEIEDRLTLPPGPTVERTTVSRAGDVQDHTAALGTDSAQHRQDTAAREIADAVREANTTGGARIKASRGDLERVTQKAKGASPEAADDVKQW